jgi:Endodeoxyribonuclease RusA
MIRRLLRFTVSGDPVAQPRLTQGKKGKSGRRGCFVGNTSLGQQHPVIGYKQHVAGIARQAVAEWNDVGDPDGFGNWQAEMDKPVRCHLVFVLPRPVKLKNGRRVYAPVKPDSDNLTKAVYDAMKWIVWKDDRQVVIGTFEKWYADSAEMAHVEVEVEQLGLGKRR